MRSSIRSHRSTCLVAGVLFAVSTAAAIGGTLTLASSQGSSGSGSLAYSGATTVNSGVLNLGGASQPKAKKPFLLTGSASDVRITTSGDGNILKVKTEVAITNSGTGAAKNVTATVYLSDDAVLNLQEDTKLATLKLADYVSGAIKLRKGQTLSLPIRKKIPAAATALLEGKYLIAVLTADSSQSSNLLFSGPYSVFSGGYSIFGTTSGLNLGGVSTGPAPTTNTANPGIGVFANLTKLSDVVLTADQPSIFSVNRPVDKDFTTDVIVPTATLKVVASGETVDLLSGEETQAQAGDELQLQPGTFLHTSMDGSWKGQSVSLTLNSGSSVWSDLQFSPGNKITFNSQNSSSTPSNQVIIGPIHLP